MTSDDLAAALDPLRTGFQADGADIELVRLEERTAVIRLHILDQQACEDECLLPKAALERILLVALKKADPRLEVVELLDPRVLGSAADEP